MSLEFYGKTLSFPQEIDALMINKKSNLRYLSGFTGSSGCLLITAEEKILVTDFRYAEQARRQAPHFKVIQQGDDFVQTLKQLVQQYKLKAIGLEKEVVTLVDYEKYRDNIPEVRFLPVSNPCEAMRRVKSEQELVMLKRAIEIADKTFFHIKDFISCGQTEKEVAFEMEFFMRRLGSRRNAFETIVASGTRSSLPHGVASDKVITCGDLVTMDYGAVYEGYHSDITRTLIMGQPDSRQEEIYNTVLKAQETAIKNIRPGIKASEVDGIAREIIAKTGYGNNFGHGLGHGVGLDIHEAPRLSPRDETFLEPGMVVTVEPGIYLQGFGGVRIEDIVVVTSRGCEVLTRSPKNIREMIITDKHGGAR